MTIKQRKSERWLPSNLHPVTCRTTLCYTVFNLTRPCFKKKQRPDIKIVKLGAGLPSKRLVCHARRMKKMRHQEFVFLNSRQTVNHILHTLVYCATCFGSCTEPPTCKSCCYCFCYKTCYLFYNITILLVLRSQLTFIHSIVCCPIGP